jgi:uncharacterized membrane protein
MTKKTFSVCRIIIAMALAIIVSSSIISGNWLVPVIAFVVAWLVLYSLRSRIKEVVADERDYLIAGKASLIAIKIFVFLAVTSGLVLYIAEKENAILYGVGSTLIYSGCFLMVLEAFLFKIYEHKNEQN